MSDVIIFFEFVLYFKICINYILKILLKKLKKKRIIKKLIFIINKGIFFIVFLCKNFLIWWEVKLNYDYLMLNERKINIWYFYWIVKIDCLYYYYFIIILEESVIN